MFNLSSDDKLKNIGHDLNTDIIGAQSGDYFLFVCVHCGKEVDLTYMGLDPSAPIFTFECKHCKRKDTLKFSIFNSHGFPRHPYNPDK